MALEKKHFLAYFNYTGILFNMSKDYVYITFTTGGSSRRFFFLGGGNLARGPNLVRYPKTENSTDLTHYFFAKNPKSLSKNKIKNEIFLDVFGGQKT